MTRETPNAAAVGRAIATALKPVLKRLAALERDSHTPVEFAPIVRAEVARQLDRVRNPMPRDELDRALARDFASNAEQSKGGGE